MLKFGGICGKVTLLLRFVSRNSKGMDVDLKRTIAAGITLLMLLCMVTASANTAGSQTDPLITLSYLNGAYKDSLKSDAAASLNSAVAPSVEKLDEIYRKYAGYKFAPRFSPFTLEPGGTITLSTGSSVILLTGSASLTVSSGAVVNVSTGREEASGAALTQYQRYFCTENTMAVITASSAMTGQVDGYYLSDGDTPAPQTLPFRDVDTDAWFYTAVGFVYANGLFSGTAADTFSPGIPMTRAMFVTVLYRLAGQPEVSAGSTLSDVTDTSQYYYNAVAWANGNGIVAGYADGRFLPDNQVTREQMAAIMYRYAALQNRGLSADGTAFDEFPDKESVSEYAVGAMRWAVANGVISGSDGRLLPQNTATRAQVAQIIYNYCERIGR